MIMAAGNHYDDLETRSVDEREAALASRLPDHIGHAKRNSGYFGDILKDVDAKSITNRDALAAGCDLVLHCCGNMAEMQGVAHGVAPLSDAAAARLARGDDMRGQSTDWDRDAALARLSDILKPLGPET